MPIFDVLREATKSTILNSTFAIRAPVNLVFMLWTLQVLIERVERPEFGVAEETFVVGAIVRPLGRQQLAWSGWLLCSRWAGDEP